MGKKKKKKSKHDTLERIVLATAILNLIKEIFELVQKFLE